MATGCTFDSIIICICLVSDTDDPLAGSGPGVGYVKELECTLVDAS